MSGLGGYAKQLKITQKWDRESTSAYSYQQHLIFLHTSRILKKAKKEDPLPCLGNHLYFIMHLIKRGVTMLLKEPSESSWFLWPSQNSKAKDRVHKTESLERATITIIKCLESLSVIGSPSKSFCFWIHLMVLLNKNC